MKSIIVKDKIVNITGISDDDYVSLSDLAKLLNEDDPRYPIQNWMRLKDTIDFIGLWEILNNTNFNRVEFDAVKNEYGRNSFVMTPTKWIRMTNAKCIFYYRIKYLTFTLKYIIIFSVRGKYYEG